MSHFNGMLHGQLFVMMSFHCFGNITNALAHEKSWLDEVKQKHLFRLNHHFLVCIGIIDGSLVRI